MYIEIGGTSTSHIYKILNNLLWFQFCIVKKRPLEDIDREAAQWVFATENAHSPLIIPTETFYTTALLAGLKFFHDIIRDQKLHYFTDWKSDLTPELF